MKSFFENVIPIDDPIVVLDLLCRRWGDNTIRTVSRWHKSIGPYVELEHCREHADSEYRRFAITERVADELFARHLVKGTPRWGYTEMRELRATAAGEDMLWDAREAAGLELHMTAEWWFAEVAPVNSSSQGESKS